MIVELRQLINRLNYLTKKYDEGTPEVSDKEWDDLYYQLKALEEKTGIIYPDSPTQSISYQVVNSLPKVTHNHKMLSLDKVRDIESLNSFIGKNDYVVMAKLDGLTCSLRYLDGKLVSAETRGNGEIGEDITHNIKIISSIPQTIPYKKELVIDGEIICLKEDFKDFEQEYKNPRNFAAGSIRLLDAKECARRHLTFIAWEVIKGFDDINCFSQRLEQLNSLGIEIVPWINENLNDAINDMQKYCENHGIPIDGVVIKFEDIEYGKSLGETSHHLKNAIAYKFYDEKYETNLLNIDWTMGRTGQLTPVAVFNPIDIDGSLVERASLHNIDIMDELLGCPYKNQKIWIYKANQIIPQVDRAEGWEVGTDNEAISIPRTCPVCGQPTEIRKDGTARELFCTNPECNGKLINRLEHFFGKKGLDVKGISLATFDKLVNFSWINNVIDVYNLQQYKEKWIKIPGFGEKSVNKILESIENSKNCLLDKFICAIGIPTIGTSTSKELAQVFKSWDNFRQAVKDKYDFSQLKDFGYLTSEVILNFDYTEADELSKILNIQSVEEKENTDSKIQGKKFVITGTVKHYKNRTELQNVIESLGGKVVSSISSQVDYLINNNIESTSAKNIAAKKLNIPIISETDFLENFID